MDNRKKLELEAKLRELIQNSSRNNNILQDEKPVERLMPCNVIRRRKGEKDKRIFVSPS